MTTPKTLATLLRVKKRRVEQLGEAVTQARQRVAQEEQQVQQARQKLEGCQAAEAACDAKIASLSSGSFRPDDLLALRMVVNELRDQSKQADSGVQRAQAQLEAARQGVVAAQRALQKGEQTVEWIEKRRQELLKELENASEEMQDEESEEAAVARMLARVRADEQEQEA